MLPSLFLNICLLPEAQNDVDIVVVIRVDMTVEIDVVLGLVN